MKKTVIATTLSSAVLLFAACGSNPLKGEDKKVAANFLVSASQYAEHKLGSDANPGGQRYGSCMRGEEKQLSCDALYRFMSEYAATTKYKGLSASNLKNKSFYVSIKEDYESAAFLAI